MNIVGISSMKNEPWADDVIRHMRAQGVDDFLISVADAPTRQLLEDAGHRPMCQMEPFDQSAELTSLAYTVAEDADWIIPFDADEYWCGTSNLTIRESLEVLPPAIDTIYAPMFLHITRTARATRPKPLPKTAFRPRADMTVAIGNHSVSGAVNPTYGPLIVRELQYRSYDHLLAKIETNRGWHAQDNMSTHEYATHMWRLINLTEPELRREWEQHLATPVVYDPIPG